MKITTEVLSQLGEKISENNYCIHLHGCRFQIKKVPDFEHTWSFGFWGELGDLGERGHFVDSIEEMIAFAFQDGLEEGKKEKIEEIREVLEVKHAS
jgi:hypothetical protein